MKKSVGKSKIIYLEKRNFYSFASPWGEFWEGLWGDSMNGCGNGFYFVFYGIIMQNIEVWISLYSF